MRGCAEVFRWIECNNACVPFAIPFTTLSFFPTIYGAPNMQYKFPTVFRRLSFKFRMLSSSFSVGFKLDFLDGAVNEAWISKIPLVSHEEPASAIGPKRDSSSCSAKRIPCSRVWFSGTAVMVFFERLNCECEAEDTKRLFTSLISSAVG